MPPKFAPKIYQLQVKTHKQTIFLTLAPGTTIDEIKREVLDALSHPVSDLVTNPRAEEETPEELPSAQDVSDFVLCREQKGEYETIQDGSKALKDLGLSGWPVLYIRFKDNDGNLLPLKYTQPNLDDEDAPTDVVYPAESDRPNKRKARPEEVVAAIGDIVDAI
ncbi:uncharacterized protein SCHCODRAFT_01219766 [Schizophyllum commune H4-8]|uniref:uncharacterized protein n=1 Tax=Schizophyllum commune (strain H4-8 / FGSC 9210) TaxID=578458 RepID=UPI002160E400|nr:uncharacterized protein SCHCODRAFT_01219766 [Schizophyllum commune H4-8]KAI5893223.1 hypothetical protein SCHCODRAFT_01219766 [Schizophyllum commune H4-8]